MSDRTSGGLGASVMVDDARFHVLHALRIKGFASVPAIVAFTGIGEDDVARRVDDLADAELVRFRSGPLSAWALTPSGRARHAEMLHADRSALESAGHLAAIGSLYSGFLELNEAFKALCTDWQLLGRTAERLAAAEHLHVSLARLFAPRLTTVERLSVYRARFERALARLRDGDDAALTRPLTDSYHDVWMELHEDLITTLGIERSTADGS